MHTIRQQAQFCFISLKSKVALLDSVEIKFGSVTNFSKKVTWLHDKIAG